MNKPHNMTKKNQRTLDIAATVAGMSSERFLSRINGLLRRRQCRDTNATGPLFTAAVLTAISSAT